MISILSVLLNTNRELGLTHMHTPRSIDV